MKTITSLFFVSLVSLFAGGCAEFTPAQISATPAQTGYTFGQEPKKRIFKDEGPYADENARELQQRAFSNEQALAREEYRHQQTLQKIKNQAAELEAAKKAGLNVSTNVPAVFNGQQQYGPGTMTSPANMPGTMPIYSPGPTAYSAPVSNVPTTSGYGYSGGYGNGAGAVSVKNRTGKLFGFLPWSSSSRSYSYESVDPVLIPAQVNVYTTYGAGYSSQIQYGSDGSVQPVRTWGPGR